MTDQVIKLGSRKIERYHFPQKHPEGYVLVDREDVWTRTNTILSVIFFLVLILAIPGIGQAWFAGELDLVLMLVVLCLGSVIGLGLLGRHWLKSNKLTPGEIFMPRFPLRFGEDFTLRYRRKLRHKQLAKPGQVQATLLAFEQVTYSVQSSSSSSNDTRTETATVWQHQFPAQEVPAFASEIEETYHIQIPRQGPASFEGQLNAVRWQFQVTVNLPGVTKDASSFQLIVIPEVVT